MENFRDSVTQAIRDLGHVPIRAEDFSASPGTPRDVCLEKVRDSDATVLILGERYGEVQKEGNSQDILPPTRSTQTHAVRSSLS